MKVTGGRQDLSLFELSNLIAAAHELKSPLALIRQLSLQLESDDMTEQQLRELNKITLTAERALRLTSDLTRATRLEDGLFQLEPLNSEQICRDIMAELEPLFTAHGRTLQLSKRTHPLLLVANRDLLRRILMNFSDNALHYSQPGTAVELQIQAFKKSGMVRIGVRDFGPALSSDAWQSLREKLARAPQTLHARPQSSGLGLFLAGRFAEVMNGSIGAVRHRDGATFYVDLQASRQLSLL